MDKNGTTKSRKAGILELYRGCSLMQDLDALHSLRAPVTTELGELYGGPGHAHTLHERQERGRAMAQPRYELVIPCSEPPVAS